MKKKVYWILLALLIISMLFSACQTTPTAEPAVEEPAGEEAVAVQPESEGERLHFCVVHNLADHPSITAVVNGMEFEADAYGDIDLTYFDPAFDPQKQLSMIEDCIALEPDAIMVNAVDPAAVVPGLKKVHDAGIPLIMHNADTNEEGRQYSLTFVGSDFVEQGRAVGQAMVKYLPDGSKGVIIQGKPGQTGVAERTNGALEVIEAAGADIQVIDEQPADWMKDKALTVMQDFLTRYPSGEINFVYALDTPMALGALEAIKAAGRQDEFKIFGVGGFIEGCDAIKAGELQGSALHPSFLIGMYTIRAARDAVNNMPLPEVINAPTTPIDPDNVDVVYPLCW
jgi:ribose transport system substrate-binding protein